MSENIYRDAPLMCIVNQLKSCEYTCEGGPLYNNVAFMELQRRAEQELADYRGTGASNPVGIHIVEIQAQYGRHRGTFYTVLGGNCSGSSIIESIAGSIAEGTLEAPSKKYLSADQIIDTYKHCRFNAEGYLDAVVLYDSTSTLEVSYESLGRQITSIRIVSWVKEEKPCKTL